MVLISDTGIGMTAWPISQWVESFLCTGKKHRLLLLLLQFLFHDNRFYIVRLLPCWFHCVHTDLRDSLHVTIGRVSVESVAVWETLWQVWIVKAGGGSVRGHACFVFWHRCKHCAFCLSSGEILLEPLQRSFKPLWLVMPPSKAKKKKCLRNYRAHHEKKERKISSSAHNPATLNRNACIYWLQPGLWSSCKFEHTRAPHVIFYPHDFPFENSWHLH